MSMAFFVAVASKGGNAAEKQYPINFKKHIPINNFLRNENELFI